MIQLDKRGCPCPIPVVEAKKALESAEAGTWVEVLVDNAIAVQNLRKLASHKGLKAEDEKRSQQGGCDFSEFGFACHSNLRKKILDRRCKTGFCSNV